MWLKFGMKYANTVSGLFVRVLSEDMTLSDIEIGSEVRLCIPGRRPTAETYQVLAKGQYDILITPMPGAPAYGKCWTTEPEWVRLSSEVAR